MRKSNRNILGNKKGFAATKPSETLNQKTQNEGN